MSAQPQHPAGTHIRPGVPDQMAIDTVVFDMDGVLLDVFSSFREVIRLVAFEVQRLQGVQDPWRPSQEDIGAFKQAGGFNDDIDLSLVLSRIALARRGGDCALIALQMERAGGGMAGLERVLPDVPQVDADLVARLFNEFYWGASAYAAHFGEPARYVEASHPGFAQAEKPLFTVDPRDRLREAGIEHIGLITGRNVTELKFALDKLGWKTEDIDAIVTGDVIRKPDPRCLDMVIDAVEARSVVYVGDTRDDWELVRGYREERDRGVDLRAIIVAGGGQVIQYRHLGIDACVKRTDDAMLLIERWKANAAPKPPSLLGRLIRRTSAVR